ncbi:MAG: hypothetical protein SGJ10_13480 [Bacteroidota bacterium]|nr:hypothetical protein [Bacteroidota bacterium]
MNKIIGILVLFTIFGCSEKKNKTMTVQNNDQKSPCDTAVHTGNFVFTNQTPKVIQIMFQKINDQQIWKEFEDFKPPYLTSEIFRDATVNINDEASFFELAPGTWHYKVLGGYWNANPEDKFEAEGDVLVEKCKTNRKTFKK